MTQQESNTVRFKNTNNDDIVCLITRLEENNSANGFTISFRTYNVTEGIGGYETTYWVGNCSIKCAKTFEGFAFGRDY